MSLSLGELAAYTVLNALVKALSRIHENPDSFRNPKLYNLVSVAITYMKVCVQEMESYDRLPEDA